ncbi:oxygen-independent coproporphyrinogen III oxidase [Roseibium sp. RKSG952]|uniref:oxygen-independent coproporphyrinogen III oxidase n=1 Tax=Roseibium sp. RKSG952 TaxID=2529384 RepID=UPI0012BB8D46|nr:oxygen-independent coproporphyrinogen III oxidase [Roseibium sp. RKSG952]MTI00210.1 oxygen-independent coproporphyrinogen III oxidase [Roseibium sp. RKSG952]
MTEQSLSYAMRTVPRYTSYPTAPHFHAGIDGAAYAEWLATLGPADTLSLYLHVPFCRDICHYCGCHTKATRQDAPLAAYGKTLGREIELVAGHLANAGPVKHIHWGGGTPSLLPEESLVELAGLMRVSFDLAEDLEHAIELDPRYVSASLAETLASMGVTRTSLGVQDFDLRVQQAIGRVQPFEKVKAATEHLRAAGLDSMNFDLMYGLPEQTPDTIRDTVGKTLDLAPSRIALFGYAHVPWMRKHQRLIDENRLPDASQRLELAGLARDALLEAGYVAIGLDHFARPDDSMAIALQEGLLKRNFQGYTTDTGEQLIGLGVSSIGKLDKGFVQNMPDVRHWERALAAGRLPVSKGLALSKDDLLRGRLIEQIMTDHACDTAAICRDFDTNPAELEWSVDLLGDLERDGLVTIQGRSDQGPKIEMTDKGLPYVRLVAAAFDAYLHTSSNAPKARHSMAV